MTAEDLKAFARREISWEELEFDPNGNETASYTITFEDLLAAADAVEEEDEDDAYEARAEWADHITEDLAEAYGLDGASCDPEDLRVDSTENDRIACLIESMIDDPSLARKNIEYHLEGRVMPLAMLGYLHFYRYDVEHDKASAAVVEQYKAYVDALCEMDYIEALEIRGYGHYGGNAVYPCDWNVAKADVEHLYALTEDASFANTLGYIYFYGRCNDGVPQYDEAFKQFSVGAFGGNIESLYKLSDMFRDGLGIPKSARNCAGIVQYLYNYVKNDMAKGQFRSKYADIALRMGYLYRDGIGVWEDYRKAWMYFRRADFALRKRNDYGDTRVAYNIDAAKKSIADKLDFTKDAERIAVHSLETLLEGSMTGQLSAKVERHGDQLILRLRQTARKERLMLTVPEFDFCGLRREIVLSAKKAPVGEYVFDRIEGNTLYLQDRVVLNLEKAELELERFKPEKPLPQIGFVSVVFQPNGKEYDYICAFENVKVGDRVLVYAQNEMKTVTVVRVFKSAHDDMPMPFERYKPVIGIAEEAKEGENDGKDTENA